MKQYFKELVAITTMLAILAAAFAAFCCLVALFIWSPLVGGITFLLLSPFLMRGMEKVFESEEVY